MNPDKSAWGPGPWQDEPDRLEFRHAGLPCLVNRNPRMGNWCGYVAVPPGHPLHGRPYDDPTVEVHGGLTYADSCQGEICHVPEPGEPDDVWWFGFDCAHAWDLVPALQQLRLEQSGDEGDSGTISFLNPWGGNVGIGRDQRYRDLAYVRRETESLADQLAGLA